jgi:hypothetical protein
MNYYNSKNSTELPTLELRCLVDFCLAPPGVLLQSHAKHILNPTTKEQNTQMPETPATSGGQVSQQNGQIPPITWVQHQMEKHPGTTTQIDTAQSGTHDKDKN